ncbi:ATP-grasp domain-containing protein [Paraburkholderia azotifigens]|uniref:ATP-grasp domain-containing protein n=1 Tax=Paraburkholderia azotifigens TaxID=2057004 RepID=A0A5C6V5C6_9BURK|nr:ATP-grasp domain-containing protein [Paraburkholderia azotifigens]TXC80463.1 ATP-grasp domain-containing protein [Paraburkholderia azotifigens]
MLPPVVVVAALSARMLAESARRAGWRVIVLDLFGDTDTRRASGMWYPIGDAASLSIDPRRVREALDAASRTPNVIGWIAGSGFEAHCDLLDAKGIALAPIGNTRDAYDAVRDPARFFALLDDAGIPHPDTQWHAPADTAGWLVKRASGTGGMHIRDASVSAIANRDDYFQRHQTGRSMSALFIADTRRAAIIGFNEQLIVSRGTRPFVYGGALGNVDVPPSLHEQIARAANAIVSSTGLRGLNSLDFIVDGGRCFVLEVNARPSATLSLHERDATTSLLALHTRVCAGKPLDADMPKLLDQTAPMCGELIVFAERERTISPEFVQRALNLGWCHDIPVTRSVVAAGAPLCSVSAACAHGTPPATLRAELAARAATILSIDTIRKSGHADLSLSR